MLMICWFCCAPSRKGEAGAEIAIPGCNTKFELKSRKKMIRNTMSISGNTTSQPKLYSLVRLSFIPVDGDLMIAMRFSRTWRRFGGLLETDNSGELFAVFQHVHDLDSGAFHFVVHRVYPRRNITLGDECLRRAAQSGRSGELTLVNDAA